MKIGIVGFGAAAIGFIEKIKNSNHEIHVFEKSKDIFSSSISGIRADGKLFMSKDMGGELDVDLNLQKKLIDFYISKTNDKKYESGKSFNNKDYYNNFYKYGFQPIVSDFYHLGTDQLKDVLKNIYDDYSNNPNIKFHFGSDIVNIINNEKNITIIDKNNDENIVDYCVVGVGRSGHKLVNTITNKDKNLILCNNIVDIGIRYEVPNHIVEDLNKEMYEFKVKYKSKTGYIVRTFCNNPSGYVVTENYDDFITVNGHAKMHEKSNNTNFAILTSVSLTEPFKDPIGYGQNIAKMTNILAGNNKIILQTYNNLKVSKRSKDLYRVFPTLDQEKFILGDINLAFPRRIIESIIDFIDNLNNVIPGINNPDNLVYAPEIKFYSNKINNNIYKNLKFIGDCSGLSRSITYATAHGYLLASELI
jgi:hypothetical protein